MGIGAVGARRKLFCAIQRLTPPPLPRRWKWKRSVCAPPSCYRRAS
jgi:hypothetical protein